MIIKKTIHFQDGLHSRNAMLLSEIARKYNGDLKIISKNGKPLYVSCSSIISIILAQILENDEIELETQSAECIKEVNELIP